MLVCINAAGETLYLMIVATDRSTLGVFRDGIEEKVNVKVHVGQSAYVDAILFHDYLRDVCCTINVMVNISYLRNSSGRVDVIGFSQFEAFRPVK
jgi:hypothetical protein